MLRVTSEQKIAFPVTVIALLLQLGLGAYALDHERQTLLRQLDTRAARLANVREAFSLLSDQDDAGQIAQWLGATLLDQEDVLFCEVKAGEGQTLFRGGSPDAEPSRRYSFPLVASRPSPGNVKTPSLGNRSAAGASSGTLYLALSTTGIENTLAEARGTLVIGILGGTALTLLLTTLIVRYTIGNTVTRLLRSVRAVSIRHFGNSTPSRAGDALEQLSEMLNILTAELQEVVEKEQRLTAETMAKQGQCEQTMR
ncbi:MAG: hypothetical protein JSW27_09095 [Phycisphaerales bacterium]|nr:MAG: hypothetical protein JSW27_09095 [Phycisphaerales bacterium]